MASRRIVCTSCEASLKVPDTMPGGKKIRCPTCKEVFALPEFKEQIREGAKSSRRAPAVEEDEEDRNEDYPEEGVQRKARKRSRKAASYNPWIVGGALAGGGVAIAVALLFLWSRNRPSTVDVAAGISSEPPAHSGANTSTTVPMPQTSVAEDKEPFAAGKKVFAANNCMRCHSTSDTAIGPGGPGGDNSGGPFAKGGFGRSGFGKGGFGKGGRGPSLAKVGADPTHTIDWLMQHIRDPKSHRPDSRMPAYEGRISDDDLRKLAEYLASLK